MAPITTPQEVYMLVRLLPLAVAAALAAPAALHAQAPVNAPSAPSAGAKKVITSADQMPRRQYTLSKLPSELLAAPKSELMPAAEALDRDLATDLATLDI